MQFFVAFVLLCVFSFVSPVQWDAFMVVVFFCEFKLLFII